MKQSVKTGTGRPPLARVVSTQTYGSYLDRFRAEVAIGAAVIYRPPREGNVRYEPSNRIDPRERIKKILELTDNWDGRGAPQVSKATGIVATLVIEAAERACLDVERIVPHSEGGIYIYFFGEDRLQDGTSRRSAYVYVTDEQEIVCQWEDITTSLVEFRELQFDGDKIAGIDGVLEEIGAFIRSQ